MKKIKMVLVLIILLSISPISAKGAMIPPNNYSSSLAMMTGDTEILTVDNVTGNIKWSSSDKAVVTVTKKGKIKAIKHGKAVVTAKVKNTKYEFSISVSKSEEASKTKTFHSDIESAPTISYITKSKYDSLSNGKTYESAVQIIGSHGMLVSTETDESTEVKTEVYSWYDKDGISNAIVTFVDGKITEKEQTMLE